MTEILSFFTTYWIVSVISSIIAVIVSAILADRKGRSVGGWIFGGLILGWIAVIILACLSDQSTYSHSTQIVEKYYYHQSTEPIITQQTSKEKSSSTHRWRCHNCRNMICADPCPFCGQVFSVKSDENNE